MTDEEVKATEQLPEEEAKVEEVPVAGADAPGEPEVPAEPVVEAPVNVPYQEPDRIGTPCPECKGDGLVGEQRCTRCTGTGRII